MRLILAIDGVFLSFFNKIARAFARLTGKSNFFLAKGAVWIVIISAMTTTLNYWIPILGRKTNPLITAFSGFIALTYLMNIYLCDKAETAALSEKRVRIFAPFVYSPIFRFVTVFVGLTGIPTIVSHLMSSDGILIAKIMDESLMPAFIAFLYLAILDPPQVGKSKIREWVEGFANSFRKPIPIKPD